MAIPDFSNGDDTPFSAEKRTIENMKKAMLMVAGTAVQKYMMQLAKEQEIIMNIADMIIETYTLESVVLRVEKLTGMKGNEASGIYHDIMKTYRNDSLDRLSLAGKNAINSMSEGDENRLMMMGLKRFTKSVPFNTKESRRRIAKKLVDEGKYCF
jgi:hypothetical protein